MSLLIISASAIIYAALRSYHDRELTGGRWKTFAFIEGIFIDSMLSWLVWASFGGVWYGMIIHALIFAFVFWLVFDCLMGYHLTGNVLYIGSQGFDKKMRETFLYNKPLFGWQETGAFRLIIVKIWWLIVLIGGAVSI